MSSFRKLSRPTPRRTATTTAKLTLHLVNHQRHEPVPLAWLTQLATRAVRQLKLTQKGQVSITFVSRQTMRLLNQRFTQHNRLTDVLSFRYLGEPIVGEILIAPAAARQYATRHGLAYRHELARYVIHGLLHWMGYDDNTSRQQHRMRIREDELLAQCASL